MIEGETRTIKQVCKRRTCEECGEPATAKLTFLLQNARHNPASSGYGGDDISYCSDAQMFVCDKCKERRRELAPRGMEWCAEFPSPQGILYWETVN